MTCKEAIKKGLCLGCTRVEQENPNADNCEYREKSGLDLCKKNNRGRANKDMNKVISREYVEKNYIHRDKILKLKEKLEKEYQCAIEGFMKKQISTSVVDGTIAQETGWILQEIDKILEVTKDANK